MIICLVRKIIQEQIFINCYKRLLLTLNNNEVYLFKYVQKQSWNDWFRKLGEKHLSQFRVIKCIRKNL